MNLGVSKQRTNKKTKKRSNKKIKKTKTEKKKRVSHSPAAGWKKQSPRRHERTVMKRRCGKKCFLGPGLSFPICTKGTCSVNQKGVHAAYGRARQYGHQAIANRAKRMMV
jgi:hypothetical protein